MTDRDPFKFPGDFTVEEVSPAPEGKGGPPGRPSTSKRLIELARSRYRFARADEGGGVFAIPREGPNIAVELEDSTFGNHLSMIYHDTAGDVPGGEAISGAMRVLQAEAASAKAEPVAIRAAATADGIIVDIGDESGRAIKVTAEGWAVVDRSPVPFRRTDLTGAMPIPERGGSVDELAGIINVRTESMGVLIGWMMACWCPSFACPILLISGGQGTGKSTATRLLTGIVDPSPCGTRPPPRDDEQLVMQAHSSRVVIIDNISAISQNLSDSLCRLCTGDAFLKRRLYSNLSLTSTAYRRAVVMNSIDVSAFRGDFGERLVIVDLDKISPTQRKYEEDLVAAYEEAKPRILGAVLDRFVLTLAAVGSVQLESRPRMADFARLLAAQDAVTEAGSLETYLGQADRVAEDVLDGSVVAQAITRLIEEIGEWRGTAGELLADISPAGSKPKNFPKTPKAMGNEIRRLAPSLRQLGYIVEEPSGRGAESRKWRLEIAPDAEGESGPAEEAGEVSEPCSDAELEEGEI